MLVAHPTAVWMLSVSLGVASAVVLYFTLNAGLVPAVACVSLVPWILAYSLGFLTVINAKAARKLLATGVFRIRVLSALVSFAALSACLSDVRVIAALYLLILQLFCALSDAMTGAMQRLRVVFHGHLELALLVVIALVYFRQVPINNVIVPISQHFDYALIQRAFYFAVLPTLVVCGTNAPTRVCRFIFEKWPATFTSARSSSACSTRALPFARRANASLSSTCL